jgi:uncharacterized membrane protein (UPF0127 family)
VKTRLFIAILLGLFAPIGLSVRAQTAEPNGGVAQSLPKVALHIGHATLNTQVAATPSEQETGLMYVTHLPDNDGMIFLLPRVSIQTFWMKNTLIPLSVAYIDKTGVILEIHDMQPGDPTVPDSELPRTQSESDQVAYALETNLHWFALNGIKPGDKIEPAPAMLAKTTAP